MKVFKNLGVLNQNSKAEKLYNMSFVGAAQIIAQMDDMEKAEIAAEIDTILLALNKQMSGIDQYTMEDGYPRPLCSMEDYMFMMSMTKRYSILLNYLFEINDMIKEQELETKLQELEALEQQNPSVDTSILINTAKVDLKYYGQAKDRTNKIVQQAKELTAKYFE